MKINKYLKKRIIIFATTVTFIIVILGVSLYNVLSNKTGDIVIKDNINYTIETEKKSTNNFPMSKEEGENLSSIHTIKVSNKDDKRSNFEIVLKDRESSYLIDKIYYKVDDKEVKKIDRKHVLYYGTLEKGESKTITIRFWLGSDLLSKEDQGRKANMYLDVYGK